MKCWWHCRRADAVEAAVCCLHACMPMASIVQRASGVTLQDKSSLGQRRCCRHGRVQGQCLCGTAGGEDGGQHAAAERCCCGQAQGVARSRRFAGSCWPCLQAAAVAAACGAAGSAAAARGAAVSVAAARCRQSCCWLALAARRRGATIWPRHRPRRRHGGPCSCPGRHPTRASQGRASSAELAASRHMQGRADASERRHVPLPRHEWSGQRGDIGDARWSQLLNHLHAATAAARPPEHGPLCCSRRAPADNGSRGQVRRELPPARLLPRLLVCCADRLRAASGSGKGRPGCCASPQGGPQGGRGHEPLRRRWRARRTRLAWLLLLWPGLRLVRRVLRCCLLQGQPGRGRRAAGGPGAVGSLLRHWARGLPLRRACLLRRRCWRSGALSCGLAAGHASPDDGSLRLRRWLRGRVQLLQLRLPGCHGGRVHRWPQKGAHAHGLLLEVGARAGQQHLEGLQAEARVARGPGGGVGGCMRPCVGVVWTSHARPPARPMRNAGPPASPGMAPGPQPGPQSISAGTLRLAGSAPPAANPQATDGGLALCRAAWAWRRPAREPAQGGCEQILVAWAQRCSPPRPCSRIEW